MADVKQQKRIKAYQVYPFILAALVVLGLFFFYANRDSILEISSYVVKECRDVMTGVFKTTSHAIVEETGLDANKTYKIDIWKKS